MKYKILENKRIKALKDFSDVKKGDIGGYVDSYANLSQENNCWLYDEAKALDNSKVYGDARLFDYACTFDNAQVFEDVKLYEHTKITEDAKVFGMLYYVETQLYLAM